MLRTARSALEGNGTYFLFVIPLVAGGTFVLAVVLCAASFGEHRLY